MSYLRGPDRFQVQLLPACVDDYVAPDAPARFLDAYVEGLDFAKLGFTHAQPKATGRPPHHPADLLKLYLYGYLHRIRSSRRLEAEAARNLEVRWLLRGLTPDFKTIADFRKDNRAAFKPLLKHFNLLCRSMNLFGAELVAIDGSKFKAVNNTRRHHTQDQLRELLTKIEARIDDYLTELDTQDAQAEGVPPTPGRVALQAKIAQLKERKGNYDDLLGALKAGGQNEASLTDADSRKMKGAHGEHFIGYNVQVAVDAKHDLIVAGEVVQAANDRQQLAPLAAAAKAELQVETLTVVADKGYHQAGQLAACAATGIVAHVPAPGTTSGRTKDGQAVFPKEQFRHDAVADAYHCPGGHVLPFQKKNLNRGQERSLYYDPAVCRGCALLKQCTTGSCRVIGRHAQEAAVEATAARVAAAPEKVARRKEIVEHVFGTLRVWGHDDFLMKGLEKVKGEFSLSAVVYNLRRVLNLRTVPELLAAVRNLACAAVKTGPDVRASGEKGLAGVVFLCRRVAPRHPDPRAWLARLGAWGRHFRLPGPGTPTPREFSHSL
jgi:transposase